jgi:hypothetical protein
VCVVCKTVPRSGRPEMCRPISWAPNLITSSSVRCSIIDRKQPRLWTSLTAGRLANRRRTEGARLWYLIIFQSGRSIIAAGSVPLLHGSGRAGQQTRRLSSTFIAYFACCSSSLSAVCLSLVSASLALRMGATERERPIVASIVRRSQSKTRPK